MAILFVASEASELKPLAHQLTGLRKLNWPIDYAYEGISEGRRVVLVANGAGPKLAARAVEVAIRAVTGAELGSSRLEGVISTGYCGALDPELQESQIVVASKVVDLATDEIYDCAHFAAPKEYASGLVVSQDRVTTDLAEKQSLRVARGAIAVEMEAAGVAARAKRAGLPFSCIKVISDRANESFGFDLNKMRTHDGRFARGKIMIHAAARPNRVIELLRLKRRTEDAARVLGDFLVSCRINSDANIPSAE